MSKHDPVNNPKHYDLFPNEQSIDLIQKCLSPEEFAGFLKGNCLKYRIRAGKKDSLEQDINKANWYQNRLWETVKEPEWPESETRTDVIGQNGNDGQHYDMTKIQTTE